MNTRLTNWPRCFDLSSSGMSTTHIRKWEAREIRRERERENRGVMENVVFVLVNPTLLGFPIVSSGTAVQLECHEKRRNIAPAREPYPALFVHSCLGFPSFPVVQQYNWSALKRNVTLQQQESRTQPCLCISLGFPIVSCGTAVQLEYPENKCNIAPAREPYPALFVHSCLVFSSFSVVQ